MIRTIEKWPMIQSKVAPIYLMQRLESIYAVLHNDYMNATRNPSATK